MEDIRKNIEAVEGKIAEAAGAAGRDGGDVILPLLQPGRPDLLREGRVKVERYAGFFKDIGRRLLLEKVHFGKRSERRLHLLKGPADHGAFSRPGESILCVLSLRAGEQTAV